MRKEAFIFKQVNERPEFRYSQAQIGRLSEIGSSQVNRFLKGTTDLPTSKFFALLESMPEDFQRAFWLELLGDKLNVDKADWQTLINNADRSDLAEIFSALAQRCNEVKSDSKDRIEFMAS